MVATSLSCSSLALYPAKENTLLDMKQSWNSEIRVELEIVCFMKIVSAQSQLYQYQLISRNAPQVLSVNSNFYIGCSLQQNMSITHTAFFVRGIAPFKSQGFVLGGMVSPKIDSRISTDFLLSS